MGGGLWEEELWEVGLWEVGLWEVPGLESALGLLQGISCLPSPTPNHAHHDPGRSLTPFRWLAAWK